MANRKVTTSSVEVFKVKGETMEIAFKNFKQSNSLDHYNLEPEKEQELKIENISNGEILKHSKKLYGLFINNKLSEYTVKGALYNHKPIIKDSSRVILHNVINRGTKQWETVNSYRYDTNEIVFEDTGTKAEALEKAGELALEKNKTINVVVSKRLVGINGVLGIAEFIALDHVDDVNVYVFWKFNTKIETVDEDELIDGTMVIDAAGQLSIKDTLYDYIGREILTA
jgi:hypothetical protein